MKKITTKLIAALLFLCCSSAIAYGQSEFDFDDPQWKADHAKWKANLEKSYFSAKELISIVDAANKKEITDIIRNKGGWDKAKWNKYVGSDRHLYNYDSLLFVEGDNYCFFISNYPAYSDEDAPGFEWEAALCAGKGMEVFFHSEKDIAITYTYAYDPKFKTQFEKMGFKLESTRTSKNDKNDVNGEWTAKIITELFVKDDYKLLITTEELGEMDDCGMSTKVLLWNSANADSRRALSGSDEKKDSLQNMVSGKSDVSDSDKDSNNRVLYVFLVMGVISIVVFFVLFRISYKKRYPIIIGIWDLVLLVVSALALATALLLPSFSVDTIWAVISACVCALTFGISVHKSIKHCSDASVRVISIVAKVAFLLAALAIIMVIIYLNEQRKKEVREKGYSKSWNKFMDYWDEVKDIAYRGDENVD